MTPGSVVPTNVCHSSLSFALPVPRRADPLDVGVPASRDTECAVLWTSTRKVAEVSSPAPFATIVWYSSEASGPFQYDPERDRHRLDRTQDSSSGTSIDWSDLVGARVEREDGLVGVRVGFGVVLQDHRRPDQQRRWSHCSQRHRAPPPTRRSPRSLRIVVRAVPPGLESEQRPRCGTAPPTDRSRTGRSSRHHRYPPNTGRSPWHVRSRRSRHRHPSRRIGDRGTPGPAPAE